MNSVKDIAIKNCTYYFFDDMISIKSQMKIKADEKSYKNVPIYHNGYVTVKSLCFVNVNSVNPS